MQMGNLTMQISRQFHYVLMIEISSNLNEQQKFRLITKLVYQKCNARACTYILRQNDYRSVHPQIIYYHPRKVSYQSFLQFLRTLRGKKSTEKCNKRKNSDGKKQSKSGMFPKIPGYFHTNVIYHYFDKCL